MTPAHYRVWSYVSGQIAAGAEPFGPGDWLTIRYLTAVTGCGPGTAAAVLGHLSAHGQVTHGQKREVPLPENAPVKPGNVVPLGPRVKKGQVREYTL